MENKRMRSCNRSHRVPSAKLGLGVTRLFFWIEKRPPPLQSLRAIHPRSRAVPLLRIPKDHSTCTEVVRRLGRVLVLDLAEASFEVLVFDTRRLDGVENLIRA